MDVEIAIAAASAFGSIVGAAAAAVAAVGIRVGIRSMDRADAARTALAAEDRKFTQAFMAALERQGAAIETLIRRTAPPQSGPAE